MKDEVLGMGDGVGKTEIVCEIRIAVESDALFNFQRVHEQWVDLLNRIKAPGTLITVRYFWGRLFPFF